MDNPVLAQIEAQLPQIMAHYEAQYRELPKTQEEQERLFGVDNSKILELVAKFVATVARLVLNTQGPTSFKREAVIAAVMEFWRKHVKSWLAESFIGSMFLFNHFVAPVIERHIPLVVGTIYDTLAALFGVVPLPEPTPGQAGELVLF